MTARRRRWPRLGVAVLIVLVLSADLVVVLFRDRATPVSYESALSRYRDSVTATTGAAPGVDGDPSTAAGPAGSNPSNPSSSTSTSTVGTAAPPSTAPATTAPAVADTRPAGGVYRYRTSGGEEIPSINAARRYPSETTGTVTRGAGCRWHYRVDLLAEHRDEYHLCSEAGAVTITSVTISIRWFGISQAIALTCADGVPVLVPGAGPEVRRSRCSGDGLTADVRTIPRPSTDVVVGGTTVRAARIDWEMDFSDQFEGRASWRLWIDPVTGLWLRVEREVDAAGATVIGRQTYWEHHTTVLRDLAPGT